MGITFWYWLTAGHCNVVTPAQSAFDGPFNWASGSATGASDSGLWYLGTYPVAAASNLIADGWSTKPISTQSDRGNFDNLGNYVCVTGATTGTGCGTLVWKWGTPLSGIYYMREIDFTGSLGGNSGGPSFGRYLNGTVSLMGVVADRSRRDALSVRFGGSPETSVSPTATQGLLREGCGNGAESIYHRRGRRGAWSIT
jgi:hypothetical protein